MPDLRGFVDRYRDSPGLDFGLWCVIGLGIVPAIITDHIFPLDGFGPRFGIDISEIVYLSGTVCLLVFLLGVVASIIQRRYWLLPLLLPWLALVFFEVAELSSQMPTPWEMNDKLYENQRLVRESENTPNVNCIRKRIDRIVYPDSELLPSGVEPLRDELKALEAKLEGSHPKIGDDVARTAEKIRRLSRQINQANTQIKSINKSLRNVSLLSRLSFGLSDSRVKKKLRSSLRQVTRHRDHLVSQRNAQRVKLGSLRKASEQMQGAYAELRDLGALVKTSLWVSESYQSSRVSAVYKLLCFGVMLVLVWHVALGSWVYLLTVAASLAVTLLYVEAPLSFRLWVVLKFVILSMILRAAFRVFSENYPLLHRQGWSFFRQTAKSTLIYYLPFATMIVVGGALSLYVDHVFDKALYDLPIMKDADPDPDAARRYNIDKAVDRFFEDREEKARTGLGNLSTESKKTTDAAATAIVESYETSIKETLPEIDENLAPPDCDGFLSWVFDTEDCVKRAVLSPLGESYTKARNDQRDRLQASAELYAEEAGGDMEKVIELTKEGLSEDFLAMKQVTKKQLRRLFLVIDFYAWVSALILAVLILKSLMYIFSRVFFATDADDKRLIQFEPVLETDQSGQVREVSDTLTLEPDMGEVLYLNKKYDFANAPPDEVTPQALKGFFSRLRHGVWHMNRVHTADPEMGGYIPYRRLPSDERVVLWTLKPGDAVVFSWRSFIGMSDSIRIRTKYSWQLSSLVFGRMFFVVASVDENSSVDGTLMLAARGSDGIGEQASPSNSPDQLLAWQTTTRFKMHAKLSFRNVYRSGIQIRAFEKDLAVMHLNDRKKRTGAAAFLKYFLVPV